MSNVLTILKIVPSDPALDREKFVKDVLINDFCKQTNIEFLKYEEEPVAYGIVAILAYLKNADSEDGTEDLNKFQELLEQREDEISLIEINMQTIMDH